MSENYFYSSLSAQEIEDTLVGAVVFNSNQSLTTSQKEQARQNIGAGGSDTKIIIEGFYDTLADLQSQIPVGTAGDVYAVGTASPYNLYIWDAISNTWKNNGAITLSDAVIDDEDIALDTTWSSSKINTQLSGKQAAISADGMLKGTGSSVQAAALGSDYTAVDDTLSSSTTKTYSIDKIKSLEPTGIVHYDQAQTLTDAQKAQARANIGAERPWTLIWENEHPGNAFAEQDVSYNASGYSELWFLLTRNSNSSQDTWNIVSSVVYPVVDLPGAAFTAIGLSDGSHLGLRIVSLITTSGCHFANGMKMSNYGSITQDNTVVVPVRIYAR